MQAVAVVTFDVEGWTPPQIRAVPMDPQSQGSHIARNVPGYSYPIVMQENPAPLARWREAIRKAYRATGAPEIPAGVPVALAITFRMRKPQSVPRERQGNPSVYPDLDKLTRAAMDALTYQKAKGEEGKPGYKPSQEYAYRDDGQVCELVVRKRYCKPDEHPGATFTLERIAAPEQGALL